MNISQEQEPASMHQTPVADQNCCSPHFFTSFSFPKIAELSAEQAMAIFLKLDFTVMAFVPRIPKTEIQRLRILYRIGVQAQGKISPGLAGAVIPNACSERHNMM